MSVSAAAERCRITVVAGERQLDLAVPADIPLVDMLPAIVDLFGAETTKRFAGKSLALQRLGSGVLDEEQTAAGLGLHDGDIVYLNASDTPLPTFAHDDLIDGVAGTVANRPMRWSPVFTRRTLRAGAAVPLALGLAAPAMAGPGPVRILAALTMAVVLLAGALLASRTLADRPAALLLGGAAIAYAALGGALAPDLAGPAPAGGARLAAAAACAAAVAAAVAIAIGALGPMVATVLPAAACAVVGGLLQAGGTVPADAAAAIVVGAVLLASPLLPSLAFRLAGMRLPDLPVTAHDITHDVAPVPDAVLTRQSAAADRYVTAGHLAIGLVAAAALTTLTGGGWASALLALNVCALLLLRFRVLTGGWQRLALLVPAGYGLALLVVRAAAAWDWPVRLTVLPAAALATSAALLAAAQAPDSRRPRPYWGRAAELAESALAVALVPSVLAVLGVYAYVRGLGG
ncbi:type VII secretion integral membrane protein EccD [Krasilnikovia cinnamomea]|uniref:type VII secretion integral membrane protein EccD n=1 Tax=Krasilnikovia cinnamomea TaxID=349313 RepID=UPI0013EEF508|nr:type VII secretion integral membrane protein EccD [Krasilnikovia cinnamomea]